MTNIKEDYLIDTTSTYAVEDNKETLNIKTTGTFKEKENKKYIIYKEYSDANPNKFKTCILKIEDTNKKITLIKNSGIQTKLILEKGKRIYSPYPTEFGAIMMGIFTNSMEFNNFENEAHLNLKYSIDVNSEFVSTNNIKIRAIKKDN